MLDGRRDLGAAEIAFFSPTLLIGTYICVRHGFNRQGGWLYIVILSILRLVGASCLLYAEVNNDPDENLVIAYAVCSSIGTAPLLLALMGFLKRINQGMEHMGLKQKIFLPIQLASLIALVLAIIGGTDQSASNPSKVDTGRTLNRVAVILFLAIWAGLSGITILTYTRIRWVLSTERKLLYAAMISIPFLLIRVAYSLAVGFSSSKSSPFYTWNVNVWAQAFMQFFMEVIVMIIYVAAGLMTPKAQPSELGARAVDDAVPKPLPHGNEELEMESARLGADASRR